MVFEQFFDTCIGRIYIAVEDGKVVGLTGRAAVEDKTVEESRSAVKKEVPGEEGKLSEEAEVAGEEGESTDKNGQAAKEHKIAEMGRNVCGNLGACSMEGCGAEDGKLLERAAQEVIEYLEGRRREFDIPLRLSGTPFQKKVWGALCKIPYGQTRTYGEIAREVGSPKGARAVGMACNRNPVMLLVPCHRVVGSTGKLVGFGGGLAMKEHLLRLEGSIVET